MNRQTISLRIGTIAVAVLALTSGALGIAGGGRGQIPGPLPLKQVRFFAYQIQQINGLGAVDALARSRYDLLVVEPTRTDWSDDQTRNFNTPAMVQRLKASRAHDGVHRKLVVAYIDIGEAENWRWYWTWSTDWPQGQPRPKDWPGYIITHDPDGWSGNFPVAYWDAAWKDIIIYGRSHPPGPHRDYRSAVDEAIRDGFDGIYLDWVEAFEDPDVQAAAAKAGVEPAGAMIRFLREIRAYARKRNPNFVVIQQNATSLLDDHPELLQLIDGLSQEDVWFKGDADVVWDDPHGYDQPQDPALTGEFLDYLQQYRDAGIPVFTVEYAVKNARKAYALARARGFVTYCSRTELSRLTTTPPPGY